MSSINAFTRSDTDPQNWAQGNVSNSVQPDGSVELQQGGDSLTIPAELLPAVQNVIRRLRGAGLEIPSLDTTTSGGNTTLDDASGLNAMTAKEMTIFRSVVQIATNALTGDTATAMMAISTERSQLLDEVVKGSVSDLQVRNEEISRLNNLLQEIRANGPKKDDSGEEFVGPISGEAYRLLEENGWDKHLARVGGINEDSGASVVLDIDSGFEFWDTIVEDNIGTVSFSPQLSLATLAELYGTGANGDAEFGAHSYYGLQVSDYTASTQGVEPSGAAALRITPVFNFHLEMADSSKNKFAELIQNIKTEIDDLSSSSQLDMVKLQGIINKKNQTVELMTTFQQKDSSLMDKLLGGLSR